MTSYKHYKKLLEKYDKNYYVKGEILKKSWKEIKRKQRLHQKHEKAYIITRKMKLNKQETEGVKYLINTFTNFKLIHRTASEETIITAFCFFYKKINNSNVKITDYKPCKDYCLTDSKFELIISRLLEHYMLKSPIKPVCSTRLDHNILLKQAY